MPQTTTSPDDITHTTKAETTSDVSATQVDATKSKTTTVSAYTTNTTRVPASKPKPESSTKTTTQNTTIPKTSNTTATTNAPLEKEEKRNVGLNFAWIRSLVQKWTQQEVDEPKNPASPSNPQLTVHKDGINASDVLINRLLWEQQDTKQATYGQLMPQKSTFANTGQYRHDIVASVGTPLYAITDGTIYHYVSYEKANGSSYLVSYGKWVMLAGDDGATLALYAHLQDFSQFSYKAIAATKVQTESKNTVVAHLGSSKVKKGDVIGYVGTTGNSHGPHLHFELYIGGKRVEPSLYVQ